MQGKKTDIFLLLATVVTLSQCASDLKVSVTQVVVHKCCGREEVLDDRFHCRHVNDTDSTLWIPLVSDAEGHVTALHEYQPVPGLPNCGGHQGRPVFEYEGSSDKLVLMVDGLLRHYTHFKPPEDDSEEFSVHDDSTDEPSHYDHFPGTYCIDKVLLLENGQLTEAQAAVVCVPVVSPVWNADFVIRRIVNPIAHVVGIACFLAVAVIYFILPPLRDLVGNIVTTISVCLIVGQAADLVRIFTEFSSHVSFLVADAILYLSLLAAFFWLNSMGYYMWRTFRSRNVFLRVSDGRKYCYYSMYAWGTTLVMTFCAIAAHFLFESERGLPLTPSYDEPIPIAVNPTKNKQKTIGWLGIALFFTPVASTILANIYFYLTTARVITRMATYGRIHGRMKFSFELFMQLFVVMSVTWLFLLLSWLQYDAVVFIYMLVNAVQGPVIFTICVLGRKSVRSLLRKGCCRGDGDEPQWGEEMMSMTSG